MMPRWLYVIDALAVAWFIVGVFYPPLLIAWFGALALTCVTFYGIWRGIHWLRRNP